MLRRRIGQWRKTSFILLISVGFVWSSTYAEDNTPLTNIIVTAAACPSEVVTIPLNNKQNVAALFQHTNDRNYEIANSKIVRVTRSGLVIPLAKGTTVLTTVEETVLENGEHLSTTCSLKLQIVDAIPYKPTYAPKTELRKVKVGTKSFSVQTVLLPKGFPVDIGLAKDAIGHVEDLKGIADKRKAEYAINGTYFEAYGGIPEPYGTLIVDGEIAHVTLFGTTIGFTADGSAKMDTLRVKIEGGTDGLYDYKHNWYSVFANRTPKQDGSSSMLFTPVRGSRIGFAYGKAIVVKGGIVVKITENENVAIPRDGFVIVLTGEVEKSLENKFEVGRRVHYRLKYSNAAGESIDWSDIITAVGAGPRVLTNGKVVIHAEKEGFTQTKILKTPAARSGIGIKADGSIILVTVGSATIKELGEIFRSLGAVQAMNLDGGASSGLYAKGKLLTTPGRLLSNSLIFGTQIKYRS